MARKGDWQATTDKRNFVIAASRIEYATLEFRQRSMRYGR